jgi:GNAT superfamily N-acetyltransferase
VGDAWHALSSAPTWREDWVAVSPEGHLAATCAIWYEPLVRAGWFEPVGTHPDFRRRGLASSLMAAALRRLWQMGACRRYVDTGYGMDANRLYARMGFTQVAIADRWVVPELREAVSGG